MLFLLSDPNQHWKSSDKNKISLRPTSSELKLNTFFDLIKDFPFLLLFLLLPPVPKVSSGTPKGSTENQEYLHRICLYSCWSDYSQVLTRETLILIFSGQRQTSLSFRQVASVAERCAGSGGWSAFCFVCIAPLGFHGLSSAGRAC